MYVIIDDTTSTLAVHRQFATETAAFAHAEKHCDLTKCVVQTVYAALAVASERLHRIYDTKA